jgi:hypothetical protein
VLEDKIPLPDFHVEEAAKRLPPVFPRLPLTRFTAVPAFPFQSDIEMDTPRPKQINSPTRKCENLTTQWITTEREDQAEEIFEWTK